MGTNASTVTPASGAPSDRVLSVDIFRGLTMLVMIFVNDLASVKGLPWWTYHMRPGWNGMTYVDYVFPAFLFIVGMSIPLAVSRRLDNGRPLIREWGHVLMRSVSLVVLGIVLANAWDAWNADAASVELRRPFGRHWRSWARFSSGSPILVTSDGAGSTPR